MTEAASGRSARMRDAGGAVLVRQTGARRGSSAGRGGARRRSGQSRRAGAGLARRCYRERRDRGGGCVGTGVAVAPGTGVPVASGTGCRLRPAPGSHLGALVRWDAPAAWVDGGSCILKVSHVGSRFWYRARSPLGTQAGWAATRVGAWLRTAPHTQPCLAETPGAGHRWPPGSSTAGLRRTRRRRRQCCGRAQSRALPFSASASG